MRHMWRTILASSVAFSDRPVYMSASPWRIALGVRVRSCRLERGWTRRQVAFKSDVPETTWRRIETGSSAVSDVSLIAVADTLGWSRGECFRVMAEALDDAERGA